MKLFFTTCCLVSLSLSLLATTQDEITRLHEQAYTLLDTDRDSAFVIGLKTEALSREAGLIWEEANSIFIQAWIQENTGESGESFTTHLRALELLKDNEFKDEKEQKLYLQLTRSLGYILLDHEADYSAETVFKTGLDKALSFNNFNEASQLLVCLSEMHQKRKNFRQANEYIDQALDLTNSINEENLIFILNQQGLIQKDQLLFSESRVTFNKLLKKTSENSKLIFSTWLAQHNLGRSYAKEGQLDSAMLFYLKARDTNKLFINHQSFFLTEIDLSKLNFEDENYTASINAGKQAVLKYSAVRLHPDHFSLFTILSKSYAALGNYQEAQKYAEMYMSENEKYLKAQEMLMKVREEFHMEELTARFFMSIDDVQDKSLYWIILSIISSSFTIILLAGMTKNHLAKRALKKSLQEISRDSWS